MSDFEKNLFAALKADDQVRVIEGVTYVNVATLDAAKGAWALDGLKWLVSGQEEAAAAISKAVQALAALVAAAEKVAREFDTPPAE